MKSYVILFVLIFSSYQLFSQEVINKNSTIEKTTYYENGQICEHGFFNSEGQLTGNWIKYDTNGNVISQGVFKNGKKQGKWIFWDKNTLKEVDFDNNKVVNFTQWSKSDYIVTK